MTDIPSFYRVLFSDRLSSLLLVFFFFNDTATTKIYTLSLHDALPISCVPRSPPGAVLGETVRVREGDRPCEFRDRKSTRLNSSHANISYAVFCLKKKKNFEELLYRRVKDRITVTTIHCTPNSVCNEIK